MPLLTATRTRLAVTSAALVLAAGAPAAYATLGGGRETGGTVTARGAAYLETRLLFGTDRPDGGPDVTDAQFMAFVDREVTPAFPEGLTVQEGRGQWRESSGRIARERSYELILLYPAAEAKARDPRIERIRGAYERAFGQESVARLDERTSVDF
ncbi:DUF3574 domain-containing protein [Streptomyces sp. WAC05374]|uniref:DUF3574 domain-containing protein n=1 Tax=Streptomyces sp. WAC05374 TaxID=2487420 RepID=UPI000F89570D|nr:DUF3574 domain-containing protein [Streptomyces sp. WAC05374]RST07594.1 DUF3574 domain-containing protein [Streptomyces sp. WAC05374]TDF40664.1 DUF3574 domain-containing protein [Streptomyces sp. WAC05374]TDF49427.1 DUF3574 domain-containing protein [Streptomyces sp. WAC05374]TDF49880.1 DUF3574 domain-containing protein [Streptomyces sp. WAC05374]